LLKLVKESLWMLKLKLSYILDEKVVEHWYWDENSSKNVSNYAFFLEKHSLNYKCF
jgi:hypothetical protein